MKLSVTFPNAIEFRRASEPSLSRLENVLKRKIQRERENFPQAFDRSVQMCKYVLQTQKRVDA